MAYCYDNGLDRAMSTEIPVSVCMCVSQEVEGEMLFFPLLVDCFSFSSIVCIYICVSLFAVVIDTSFVR